MTSEHRAELLKHIDQVFASNPSLHNHRRTFPWLTGALGDPEAGVWFVGENPSLGQVERVTDPNGGRPTEEAQWWASRGDRLFRELLQKHGFKSSPPDVHGGWRCYITNAIKEADYAQNWRGSPTDRRREAARVWAPVLEWQLEQSRPHLVVALGKTVHSLLLQLSKIGVRFPRIEMVQHYTYVAMRPRGTQGPMHPDRLEEYDAEFARIAELHRSLRPALPSS
jgi:uracil-DNA glycosylase